MEITRAIIDHSVRQKPFGASEPFITGDEQLVLSFYSDVLAALERLPQVSLIRELDHHGSGYASYISAFLFPRDKRSCRDFPDRVETAGILLYMSRLAPIAVFGASGRSENKQNNGRSSGFISIENLGILPDGDWTDFLAVVRECLQAKNIELLPKEPLLLSAPEDVRIPTVFDGPYYVFDTLFYWSD